MEYGLGRKHAGLLVVWPYAGGIQKVVIELKIIYKTLERTIEDGLKQAAAYMKRCKTADGHRIVFDRKQDKSWNEKIFRHNEKYGLYNISVWGM